MSFIEDRIVKHICAYTVYTQVHTNKKLLFEKVSKVKAVPQYVLRQKSAASPSLLTLLQTSTHCNHIKLCLMYYVKFSGDLPGEGSLEKFNIAAVHM